MVIYDDVAEKDPIKVYEKHIEPPKETEEFAAWKFAYHYGPERSLSIPAGEPLQIEVSHFIECIENGLKPHTDGENGRIVVAILHAAQLSLQNGGRAQFIDYEPQRAVVYTPKNYNPLGVGALARRAALMQRA